MPDLILTAQKALFKALDDSLSCNLYDGMAPPVAEMPYVTFNDVNFRPSSSEPLDGIEKEAFFTFVVWSETEGRAEVSGIIDEIDTLLHKTWQNRLPLDVGHLVRVWFIRGRTIPEGDGTFMGQVTIRMLIEED